MPKTRLNVAVAHLGPASDVLLSTQLLQAIKKAHPECRLTFVVARHAAQILDYSPFINELVIWPDSGKNRRNGLVMVRKLWRRRFDIAITLTPNAYLSLAFALGRSRTRIVASQMKEAAAKMGIAFPDGGHSSYIVTPTEHAEAVTLLNRWDVDPSCETLVAIHPGDGPFAETIQHIAVSRDCKTILLGERREREIAASLAAKPMRNVVDLTSRLNFREAAAVLSECHLLVHDGSMSMHLADAMNLPAVQLSAAQSAADAAAAVDQALGGVLRKTTTR